MEQVTPWMVHGSFGVREFRIHKRLEAGVFLQRHEYRLDDGTEELTPWRSSNPVWFYDPR